MTGYWPAVSVCFVIFFYSRAVYDRSFGSAAFAHALHELDEQLLGFFIEVARHVDLHRDVVVAVRAGAQRESLAAQPQLLAARGAGRDLHLGLAVDGRDGGDRAED